MSFNNLWEDEADGQKVAETPSPLTLLRIKLSAAQNGRSISLIAYEWKTLIENCMFNKYIEAQKPDDTDFILRSAVQTFYEEPVVETDTVVIPDPQSQKRLPSLRDCALELVYLWCREMGHGMHDQPRLEMMTPEAWCLNCVQTHKNIRLAGFELGNLINFGLFMRHYEIDMQDVVPNPACMLQKGDMDLVMEHDCRRLSVQFTLADFNVQRNDRVWHLYKMNLDYGGIHAAVADFSETSKMPNESRDKKHRLSHIALYLCLKYPPKVVVDKPRQSANYRSSREIQAYGKRTHTFFRTADVLNWGKRLGRSCVLKLIYPVNGDVANREHCINEFWDILSRLKFRARIHVYFNAVRTYQPESQELDNDSISDDLFNSFACFYLMKALLSRGYAVLDQVDPKFISLVADASFVNASATEKALEQLVAAVDEHRYISLNLAFERLYTAYATSSSDIASQVQTLGIGNDAVATADQDKLDVPLNCVRVRKIIVTPTRLMLMPPEVMMANRVLRKFGEEYALRILFRDEDGNKLRADRMQEDLFKNMVSKILIEGQKLGKRHYKFLAWSNSQLRDHGCYMYATTNKLETVGDIRTWMGDFTASANVPKMMSRMGQCFTQAQEALCIPNGDRNPMVRIEHDVTSVAKDPSSGEPYVFSDGIGCLSMALATKIRDELELTQPVPSAYQIRYAGCKGMLSVDVRLDKKPQGPQLILRDSMKKFHSDKSWSLEIVKYSQPSPVYLNRPLIMILDQVSRKQGCGPRVATEIHKLLEQELFNMADMLLSEDVSVEALVNRTPLRMDFKKLRLSGFKLTDEAFFRGLLLAVHKYTIKAQLFKAKVEIPHNQGRTMYGVLDELNVLQYGQVFVQYSENMSKPGENVKILRGDVMVTKNPCLVPGDVRIFKAVQKDALKHLVDVIVFPRNGPRPHTDEMAGSDLDGDEYAVYWNPNLMFVKNEPAMHFPKVKPQRIEGGVQDSDMIGFFINYVRQDSIGTVANAHLVMADQKDIYDPLCMSIARKCSAAVDFPKTGVPAEPLTEEEQPYRYPDFMQKDHKPMYRSWRLLGQIFRKIKMVADTVEVGQVEALNDVTFDPDLELPGWQDFYDAAVQARQRFEHHLQALLDQYGIQDESQLISGHMVTVRNRISDGEKEDFSFYNTERIVELRTSKIREKFRREFFDEFGGEREELLESPTPALQHKASAYYMVTYLPDKINHTNHSCRMISFPWLVWDILAYVKQHRVYERGVDAEFVEPVHSRLTQAIERFNSTRGVDEEKYNVVKSVIENAPDAFYVLRSYGADFANLLYVVLRWCDKERVFFHRRMQQHHVALLLIDFASGQSGFTDKVGDSIQYILPVAELKKLLESATSSSSGTISLPTGQIKRLHRVGPLCLHFVKYLASQFFRGKSELDFTPYGLNQKFARREWYFLNSIAFKTYHHIAWTSRFNSLHLHDPDDIRESSLKWDRDELDPIPVQLSLERVIQRGENNVWRTLARCGKLLKDWSGMEDVQMRQDLNARDADRYLVVGIGSLEARNKLKELLLMDELEDSLQCGQCPETRIDE